MYHVKPNNILRQARKQPKVAVKQAPLRTVTTYQPARKKREVDPDIFAKPPPKGIFTLVLMYLWMLTKAVWRLMLACVIRKHPSNFNK